MEKWSLIVMEKWRENKKKHHKDKKDKDTIRTLGLFNVIIHLLDHIYGWTHALLHLNKCLTGSLTLLQPSWWKQIWLETSKKLNNLSSSWKNWAREQQQQQQYAQVERWNWILYRWVRKKLFCCQKVINLAFYILREKKNSNSKILMKYQVHNKWWLRQSDFIECANCVT